MATLAYTFSPYLISSVCFMFLSLCYPSFSSISYLISSYRYPVPDFDFRVPGVTSISIDTHKVLGSLLGSSTETTSLSLSPLLFHVIQQQYSRLSVRLLPERLLCSAVPQRGAAEAHVLRHDGLARWPLRQSFHGRLAPGRHHCRHLGRSRCHRRQRQAWSVISLIWLLVDRSPQGIWSRRLPLVRRSGS